MREPQKILTGPNGGKSDSRDGVVATGGAVGLLAGGALVVGAAVGYQVAVVYSVAN